MAELSHPEALHTASLALESLNLEIYTDPALTAPDRLQRLAEGIQTLWPQFLALAGEEGIFDVLPVQLTWQSLEVELTWTANAMMHSLNRQYRGKDSATDVLSFTLLADAEDRTPWLPLPVLHLGSVFISLEWADAAATETPGLNTERYLLERFIHGMLHLLGLHHDTMPDYERVVGIQNRVLSAAFGPEL